METRISITEYCRHHNLNPDFLLALEQNGTIVFTHAEETVWIIESQLTDVDRFVRWHQELEINEAGIDVIRRLLDRQQEMADEIRYWKSRAAATGWFSED